MAISCIVWLKGSETITRGSFLALSVSWLTASLSIVTRYLLNFKKNNRVRQRRMDDTWMLILLHVNKEAVLNETFFNM